MTNNFTRRAALRALTVSAGLGFLPAEHVAAGSPRASGSQSTNSKRKKIAIVLFDGFTVLDVFGPVQMWGMLDDYEIVTVSEKGAVVTSSQGVKVVCQYSFADAPQISVVMVPGGAGVRTEVNNAAMLSFLRQKDRQSDWTTSVCTGAALLAKAGILDGRKATTNKIAYRWATSQSTAVDWQPRARWVVDGKYVTSSGVSAGMDMALGLIEILHGYTEAAEIARSAEYMWNSDPRNDAFAV